MKKFIVAAIAFGGLCFAASANAAVMPAGAAHSPAASVSGLTEIAMHNQRHRRSHYRPHHRRPVCKTVLKRERVGHNRWVQRRVRVCR